MKYENSKYSCQNMILTFCCKYWNRKYYYLLSMIRDKTDKCKLETQSKIVEIDKTCTHLMFYISINLFSMISIQIKIFNIKCKL